MRFTRWLNRTDRNYNSIIENINNFEEWREIELDPITREPLKFNIIQIQQDILEVDDNYKYNYSVFRFSYEHLVNPRRPSRDRNERIKNYEINIIIYEEEDRVYFCINRSGNFALTALRKFNNLDLNERQGIISAEFNTSNDFIDWLFYGDNSLGTIVEQPNLIINKITGFKGNVTSPESVISQISGNGNEIMNALSTLAFMFETEGITYVKLKVSYMENHELEFGLFVNGAIEFEADKYQGDLFFGNELNLYGKILILISTHIFPKIKAKHISLANANDWGTHIKICRIEELGNIIQGQVDEKISVLNGG